MAATPVVPRGCEFGWQQVEMAVGTAKRTETARSRYERNGLRANALVKMMITGKPLYPFWWKHAHAVTENLCYRY